MPLEAETIQEYIGGELEHRNLLPSTSVPKACHRVARRSGKALGRMAGYYITLLLVKGITPSAQFTSEGIQKLHEFRVSRNSAFKMMAKPKISG